MENHGVFLPKVMDNNIYDALLTLQDMIESPNIRCPGPSIFKEDERCEHVLFSNRNDLCYDEASGLTLNEDGSRISSNVYFDGCYHINEDIENHSNAAFVYALTIGMHLERLRIRTEFRRLFEGYIKPQRLEAPHDTQ